MNPLAPLIQLVWSRLTTSRAYLFSFVAGAASSLAVACLTAALVTGFAPAVALGWVIGAVAGTFMLLSNRAARAETAAAASSTSRARRPQD